MRRWTTGALLLVLLSAGCGGDAELTMPVVTPQTTSENGSTPSESTGGASTRSESVEDEATPSESPEGEVEASEEVIEGEGLPTWRSADGPVVFTCSGESAEGVVYTIPLPVDENHEAIKMMEGLRQDLGAAEKPNYIFVEIDATRATTERGSIYALEYATIEYESRSAQGAEWIIEEWKEHLSLDDNSDIDLYNQGVEVHNTLIATVPNRGAKGYRLLVADAPVESVVVPYVMPDIATFIPCDPES